MYFLSTTPTIIEQIEEYKIESECINEATYTFHIEKIRRQIVGGYELAILKKKYFETTIEKINL